MTDLAPDAILDAAARRQLKPGEVNALAAYVQKLESSNLERKSAHVEQIKETLIQIGLDHDGALLLVFPDQHTARIPVGLLAQDNALAMQALLRVLRGRVPGKANWIGTAGSPTQYDLREIMKQLKRQPEVTRVPSARKQPAPRNISLADLDLDVL